MYYVTECSHKYKNPDMPLCVQTLEGKSSCIVGLSLVSVEGSHSSNTPD